MKEIPDDYLPKYQNARQLKETLGISRSRLEDLVIKGYVRSIKFGESKQSGRLYRTADVLDSLDRMSIGYQPRRRKVQSDAKIRGLL